ncbi:DUF2000 domain-containing protein [Pseudoalteromonas piscicida]|uniref:DUF2000 domain-containing protein n=1 Tax=Pseudoalteromonas piscicida TaxID=43662 RepID=UPI001C97B9AD|nr:DUF2000 domain-containing protein [Pseudoalteromonas piscicida]MCG9771415.1 DUF2000 domain-containing protein [Pseudoalteromonas piscicida]QZO15124.1 DUF2000 domain-containing protein [Pseudoalteromonas piscicida]
MTEKKVVLVIDENLPAGVIANTAAVLGVSLGKLQPELVGENLSDEVGSIRAGITTVALPILKGNDELLRELREKLKEFEPELTVVDLIGATRTTKSYEEYASVLKSTPVSELDYQGIALAGEKKIINKFTGNLGLLR